MTTTMRSTGILFLLASALILGCSKNDDTDDIEDNDDPGKYELTFRGQRTEWPGEQVGFHLNNVPKEEDGIYTLDITMEWSDGPESHSTGVYLSFYTDHDISNGEGVGTYNLVHMATFADEMGCYDNPAGCLGVGIGQVAGTEPKGGPNTGAGTDNDIHAQTGTLTITELTILGIEGGIIKGRVSGHFELSGINTNASKPNPGTASGRFENAPFETLDLSGL